MSTRLQRAIAEGIREGLSGKDSPLGHSDEPPRPKTVFRKEFSDDTEFREFIIDVVNVHKWKSVLWELDQKFRAQVKYNCNPRTIDETDVWQEARDLLHGLIRDEGLEFP